jgi:hypothetical protein
MIQSRTAPALLGGLPSSKSTKERAIKIQVARQATKQANRDPLSHGAVGGTLYIHHNTSRAAGKLIETPTETSSLAQLNQLVRFECAHDPPLHDQLPTTGA